ncbi:retrotransposon-related protein [Tanacetum coccineum]
MPAQIRSGISPMLEDSNMTTMRESFLVSMREEMERFWQAKLNSQNENSNGGMMQRQNNGDQRTMQFSRLAKVEFLKFGGEDIRGWMFRCEQFFTIEQTADEGKISLISIHLYDIALVWHRKYVRFMGNTFTWPMYRDAILKRFGLAYDDPLAKIKKLKQTGNEFFIAGLQSEIELAVRMFKPTSLAELYRLCKLQESQLNVGEQKGKMPLLPTPSGQVFLLEVIVGNEEPNREQEIEKCLEEEIVWEKEPVNEEIVSPQISLNALNGINNYQTMRVNGWVGETFTTTVMILPLGGCEMVLGIQWLATLVERATEWDSLLSEFEDVFSIPTSLPPNRTHDHKIPLKTGTQPINVRPYRHPPTQNDAIKVMVKELLDAGVIRHSQSSFVATIVMVKKEDGSWRMSGYHQIRMFKDDIAKTAFKTHEGHYEFLVMPFGLTNAPSTFQALMNELYAKRSKCVFGADHVEYLGHIITSEGVATDPTKIEAMKSWPTPKTLKQLRGFLGLTGYYRRFIRDYAIISQPLTALLKKNAFKWDDKAQDAFEELKKAMVHAPVLQMPDFEATFIVETDASGLGIGAVLQQNGHPIAFMSKTLAAKHHSLSTYEKEFLAVIQALNKWRADALSRLANTGEILQINVVSLSADLYQKIVEGWEKDKKLQEIVSKLQQDGNSVKHYEWSTHQLMRKGKLVVGDDLQLKQELFKCFHESSQGGHSGVQATLKRISAQVYWKKMKKEVKEWVRTCVVCQRFKPELVQSPGLLQPLPIPERVWTHISMDFIDGLPMSKGKSVLLVVVDRLSKYGHFIPLTHPYSALTVAQAFLDNVYKLHGLPKVIVSDRDTIFFSRFWSELFKMLQVGLHMSTTYHPQTDGQTEVVNRCVECYLRCMTGDKPKEWVQWVPLAEYWYNTSFHTSIKTTPYQVLYGQAPPAHVTYTAGDSANESVDRSLVAREAVIQLLKFHLLRAQDRMKAMADRKRTERVFGIDDLVLLKLQPYRQSTLRQHKHHKLAPKYYGPFKIIARIGEVAYKLDLPVTSQIHPVFHVSQLKQFKGSVSQVSVTLPQCDSVGVIALEPVAVLDRRMAKRGNVAAVYVLIQWSNEGVNDATWELYDDIAERFPHFDLNA